MNDHPKNPGIQEYGIRVLANAAQKNPEIASWVVKIGGSKSILAAMNQNPSHKWIQYCGLIALCHLMDTQTMNEALLKVQPSSVAYIITRLEQATIDKNEDRVEETCKLVEKLCRFENQRMPLLKANAVNALATAFDNHEDNDVIKYAVQRAMARLVGRYMESE